MKKNLFVVEKSNNKINNISQEDNLNLQINRSNNSNLAINNQKIWKCISFDASNTVTQSYRASKNIDVYNFDVFLMLTR